MGLFVEVNNLMLGSLGGYTVGRSLRFRSSATAYLNRTPASASNQQKWTWSGWVKRGALGALSPLFAADSGANRFYLLFDSTDQIRVDGNAVQIFSTTAVYRDPSAWYHVVLTVDTTQATAANRFSLYVNGVQVTVFSTDNRASIAQNATLLVNAATTHNIARDTNTTTRLLDGYLAEVNFIDGQALTPSSFGAYDTNGVWQPKKYSGTYGTNGFYLPFNWSTSTSFAGSFNGSTQYLTVPTNSAFDFGSGDWTIEAWILTDSTTNRNIVAREYTGNGSNYTGYIFSTTQLVCGITGAGAWDINFSWSLPSANQWHHYAAVRNGNVYSVYIDGIRVGTQTVAGTLLNGFGGAFTIGYRIGQSLPNGSISNLRVVKGTAVYTSNFTPPSSALTAISGTSLLTLQSSTVIDNSTNAFTITNVGSVAMAASSPFGASVLADASGNNNGWSGNNINYSAYGTTYDSMVDSPTNAAGNSTGIGNYAVLNPLYSAGGGTFSNGNLQVATGTSTAGRAIATMGVSSGKWYWEITPTSIPANVVSIGFVANPTTNDSGTVGNNASEYGYLSDGQKFSGGSAGAYGASYVANDVIGVALDLDAGTLVFYKNGTSQGTAYSSIPLTNTYVPAVSDSSSSNSATFVANFGQRPFSYTPPSGFKALNTYNLPVAPISNGAQHFAATLYTGNGGTQTISNAVNNVSFQPDFAWMKARNNTYSNLLFDSVRGGTKRLMSNDTIGDTTVTGGVNSFNTDGITIQNDASLANLNASATTYVGWQWKGGGTAVTNNSGTISSQVSANTSASFSIVTYTGTGANATVGHGLGVAPSMIIIKNRTDGTRNWQVYHASQSGSPANGSVNLNLTNAYSADSTVFNNTMPTSSVFSIGTAAAINANTQNFVAYCFAAVRGYSAFGSYTGNGSADGPFVFTNFRPRWLLIKRSSSTADWILHDTSRSPYNLTTTAQTLAPNLSDAEGSVSFANDDFDMLSNGFKIRNTGGAINFNGDTYIYAAFAESPFNLSRAR